MIEPLRLIIFSTPASMNRRAHSQSAMLCALALGLQGACNGDVTPPDDPGPPSQATIVSGDDQEGVVGGLLPAPLVLQVTDVNGKPVPWVKVEWSVISGSLEALDRSTDGDGRAEATWRLPAKSGVDSVEAVVEGIGSLVFDATVQPISGPIGFRLIDAGGSHACGITTTEQLLCWGGNDAGQLGTDGAEPALFPTLISESQRYRLVSGGTHHTCASTLAGEARCWGDNRDGRASPPAAPSFRALSSGRVHTCGLTLGNQLLCWGWNGEGELAPGGTFGWSSVSVGNLYSCGITMSNEAQCWGVNESGQLGRGTTTRQEAPDPVAGGIPWRTSPFLLHPTVTPDFPLPPGPFIATGSAHTCALRDSDGGVLCWGYNQDGQLGDGERNPRPSPGVVAFNPEFVRITAGDRHTCALNSTGQAFCWGDNTSMQIGDNTTTDRLVPTAVSGELTFVYLEAGGLFTCGLTVDGVAYCWGDNTYGELGNGSTIPSPVPVKVAFQP
jgi:hypothetical protein